MKRKLRMKRVALLLGIIATVVGIWVQLGLPTFAKKDPKKPAIKIEHHYEGDMPVQSVLIPGEGDTTEVRTPLGASKIITIEDH